MDNPAETPRYVPKDNLDYNLLLTDTVWGSENVNEEFRDKLKSRFQLVDNDGNPVKSPDGEPIIHSVDSWARLSYFTRDLRLGNLGENELSAARHFLDLAGDCLNEGYSNSFSIAISRTASIVELSQSKKGFLRKWTNTLRNVQQTHDDTKKSFFKSSGGAE